MKINLGIKKKLLISGLFLIGVALILVVVFSNNFSQKKRGDIANEVTTLLKSGDEFQAKGNYGEAIKMYAKAAHLNPKNPEPLGKWGFLLYTQGKCKEAIEICEKLLQLNPQDVQAIAIIADCLSLVGRYNEAVSKAKDLIKIQPDNFRGYWIAADALFLLHRFPEALENSEKALVLCPKDNPLLPRMYYVLGTSLSGVKRYQEAETMLQEATFLDPDFEEAFMTWAILLEGVNKDLIGAKDKYQKAMKAYRAKGNSSGENWAKNRLEKIDAKIIKKEKVESKK